MNETIIAKIRKMLATASHTNTNTNEAEAALKLAQRLALKHQIDLATIGEKEKVTMIRETLHEMGRLKITQKYVSDILVKFFNVRIVSGGNREKGRYIVFLGSSEDVETAMFLNNYLNETFQRLMKEYLKKSNNCAGAARESYYMGLYNGLSQKLQEQKSEMETLYLTPANCNQYGIMVKEKRQELQLFTQKQFPNMKTISYRIADHNAVAREQGIKDGRKIEVNRGLGYAGKEFARIE